MSKGVIFIDKNGPGTNRKVKHEDNPNSRTGHMSGEQAGTDDAEIRPG